MRRVVLALALLVSLGAAQSAFAAPMNFTATLTVRIPAWDNLPPSNGPATWTSPNIGAGVTDVTGPANSFSLPMLTFLLQASTTFFTLDPTNAVEMDFNNNRTGSFTGSGGGAGVFGGSMPLVWNLFLSTTGGSFNFSDPVLGLNTTAVPNTGNIDATIVAQAFSTGAPGGFDNRNAAGVGTLQMVAPFTLDADTLPSSVAGFAELTITFVPEPGTLLMMGTGVLGLAVMARRSPRSRRQA